MNNQSSLMFAMREVTAYAAHPNVSPPPDWFDMPVNTPVIILDPGPGLRSGRHVRVLSPMGLVYVYEFALSVTKREP